LVNDKQFAGYKFSALLRTIEDPNPYRPTPPVQYEVIENKTFKTIVFLITIIVEDLKNVEYGELSNVLPQGIQETSNGPIDYFLLYSMEDKIALKNTGIKNLSSEIADIKLSCGLNGSFDGGSLGKITSVSTTTSNGQGRMYIIPNDQYETDLREEISSFYPSYTPTDGPASPGYLGAIGPYGSNGTGAYSFYGKGSSSNYTLPWPSGVSNDALHFSNTIPVQLDSLLNGYFFDFRGLGIIGVTF